MHELSLIESMLDQLSKMKIKYQLAKITDVHVSVGEMSGVDLGYLKSTFDLYIPNTTWAGLQMHLSSIPWRIRCRRCMKEQVVHDLNNQCESCGSNETETLQGMEFLIQRIEGEPHV